MSRCSWKTWDMRRERGTKRFYKDSMFPFDEQKPNIVLNELLYNIVKIETYFLNIRWLILVLNYIWITNNCNKLLQVSSTHINYIDIISHQSSHQTVPLQRNIILTRIDYTILNYLMQTAHYKRIETMIHFVTNQILRAMYFFLKNFKVGVQL